MKKSFYIISIVAVLISLQTAFARILTCNNDVLSAGQYTSIQAAHDAAAVGDTIYISPSTSSYGNVTISKTLYLIGGGYYVTGTQFNKTSNLGTIYFNNAYGSTITGGVFLQGIQFNYLYGSNTTGLVNNVVIDRCQIINDLNIIGNNWIIRNSSFNNMYVGYYYPNGIAGINTLGNIIVANNLIYGTVSQQYTVNQSSMLIINNLFYEDGRIGTLSYVNIANNIFFFNRSNYMDPNGSCSFCSFNNNVTFSTLAAYTNLPNAANTGGGNYNNTNPNFVNSLINSGNYLSTTEAIVFGSNWRLKNPILGTDGTDVGIYGGSTPMVNLGGVPSLPQILYMNINTVVPQGGTLNLNFRAKKQN